MTRRPRRAAFGAVATELSLLSDRRLADAVASATALGSGIGGRAAELEIAGTPVFAKRVPLTDLELRPEHARSTANLFGLPLFYQYGIGSSGFGAWRELAAHTMATHWVLTGACADFPLLYHWRILPDSPPAGFTDVFGGIDGAVAHWEGSPAVRTRLEAIARASFSLVLFLEHVPWTLADWLADHPGAASSWVGESLLRGTAFMNSRGLVHFDAHFRNVLTDGRRLYFSDFGLALSSAFDLSPAEAAFHARHRVYDPCYVVNHLRRHHLPHTPGPDHPTTILGTFHRRLLDESKRTPFPAEEIEKALERHPLSV
ncbi:BUD32 family EKC/KEOPS complex subunit [Streptomyces litchfieldiae]|uniref:Protein kinase family protein n=1 Tax=Streptomyces litchfieldiae TaxID=3075543 RepID=A0ABU2N065_9ACTN|nr:protein kinase family protein [Streptomyces sp. DSM 44938]MDT0346164.1 protein kinase family protein [Streptomyces sp. DSM 44938]